MNPLEFMASWGLFAQPYALTIVASMMLAIVGVVTAARRQVFMAAAVAQASTFGYALAIAVTGATAASWSSDASRDAVVIGSALVASMITMLGSNDPGRGGRLDGDERTAWVFIASGAGAILVLAESPVGMEHFRRIQASSVIGATTFDLAASACLLALLALVVLRWSRPLVLLLADPVMASAVGMRVRLWDVAIAVMAGLCVGLGVRSAGMLFTFGALALPVMIAKQWCGEIRSLFRASPLIAGAAAFIGLWIAYARDLPPGQVVVALLCLALLASAVLRHSWEATAR